MNAFCAICYRHPSRFAAAGVPLSVDCFSCADFNGKKYNRERRKDAGEQLVALGVPRDSDGTPEGGKETLSVVRQGNLFR